MRTSEWTATDSDDNAASTATKAAVAGKRHYITAVTASFSATVAGKLLTVKKGTTTLLERYVYDAADLILPSPLAGDVGGAVSAELAASGAGGTVGKVGIVGYTEG